MEKFNSDSQMLPIGSSRFVRTNSFEVISDEEIKSETGVSETAQPETVERNRRKKVRTVVRNAMSGFVLRCDVGRDGCGMIDWVRFHVVISEGIIVFSRSEDLMIESRLRLSSATVREVRVRGCGGALFLQTRCGAKMLLRFRNRADRLAWRNHLRIQTTLDALNGPVAVNFTQNKRRQIYFIDGTEEFQLQVEQAASIPEHLENEKQSGKLKRKGSVLENIATKIRKVSHLVNCFANLKCD